VSFLFREEISCPFVHPIMLGLLARILLPSGSDGDDFRPIFACTASMSRYTKANHTVYMTFLLSQRMAGAIRGRRLEDAAPQDVHVRSH
jgi:hypothetical protein